MKIRFPSLMLCLLPVACIWSAAIHACPFSETRIFYCQTTNGKEVEVCDAGTRISYRFGHPGQQPEMALSVARAEATTWQWPGVGRYMSYSVTVPNGATRYTVFFSVDRLSESHEIEAGINVDVNGEHVATVACRVDTLEQRIEGVDLRLDDD